MIPDGINSVFLPEARQICALNRLGCLRIVDRWVLLSDDITVSNNLIYKIQINRVMDII